MNKKSGTKLFLSALMVAFVLFSCGDEGTSSPILVFLTPDDVQLVANSGDKVIITIDASTSGSNLDLNIETIDDLYGIVQVFDSSFTRNSINFRFQYDVPSYPDSTQSLMIFSLANDLGQTTEIAKRFVINRGETFLKEASGIEIFSSASNKQNAYSIVDLSPVFSDIDSASSDIIDRTEPGSETLSRTWGSFTDISFVEFNGFNYASATSATIRSAYENGVKLSQVTGVSNSDIYIIGRNQTALAAIQVIAVTDQADAQEDKYTFSIKVIED